MPAALEASTTRLEVRDASSEHYQKWVDYFTSGPQSAPSFGTPLPQTRLGGTQLVGPKFRQGEPNAGGQSEIYDQTVRVYPSDAENGDAADSTISVMAGVLHYTSPLAWLFITVDEWEMAVEQVHGGWIRFAWRTRDRLAGRQVDDAVEGAGAFAGGIAAESRYSKLAELHLELHRGTAGAHGITSLAQPGLHGRQRRALEAVLDYSLPATVGDDADGPLLTDMVKESSLRLSPMDAQDGMQTAPLADAIVDAVSSEAIPGGILAGALQARRIGNVGLRRAVANAGQVAEGIKGAPRSGVWRVSSGGLRNELPLTAAQRAEAAAYARSLGATDDMIRFSNNMNTGYANLFGEEVLYIGTDVLPGTGRVLSANSRVTMRGALAHEVVGHRSAALAGRTNSVLVLEEAQASIRAARFAPGLTNTERYILLRDAIARLRAHGIRIRTVKGDLWITNP